MILSSCLKDTSNYVDFSKASTTVSLSLGGALNFSADAVTADTANITIAVNVASPTVPSTATTVTLAVDQTLTTAYNASQSAVQYLPLPTSVYSLASTTVTVPAGQNYGYVKLVIYKNKLDPTLSYMLPIKIVSSSPSYTIASNFAVSYFHVIGNDFAGTYEHYYTRYNGADSTGTITNNKTDLGPIVISPVTPTQFEVHSYYYEGPRYEVTYTKTGMGATATFSNFAISLNTDDVKQSTADNANVTYSAPKFYSLDPTKTYTKAQVIQQLKFILPAASSGSPRYTIDQYVSK